MTAPSNRKKASTSNNENQEKEDTESESKPDDAPTEDTAREKSKGKRPMEYGEEMVYDLGEQAKGIVISEPKESKTNVGLYSDFALNFAQELLKGAKISKRNAPTPKRIVILGPKKPQTDGDFTSDFAQELPKGAKKSKRKAPAAKRGTKSKAASSAKSSYSLRSTKKGASGDFASDFARELLKGADDAANVHETDVLEEDPEEPCRRNKEERYSDDDKDMGGAQAGLHGWA